MPAESAGSDEAGHAEFHPATFAAAKARWLQKQLQVRESEYVIFSIHFFPNSSSSFFHCSIHFFLSKKGILKDKIFQYLLGLGM